jgi:hypothetical protein
VYRTSAKGRFRAKETNKFNDPLWHFLVYRMEYSARKYKQSSDPQERNGHRFRSWKSNDDSKITGTTKPRLFVEMQRFWWEKRIAFVVRSAVDFLRRVCHSTKRTWQHRRPRVGAEPDFRLMRWHLCASRAGYPRKARGVEQSKMVSSSSTFFFCRKIH